MIRLSILVATYNRAQGLIATLGTLCEQTLSKESFEVVVVNNNSSDDTEARFREFAASHPDMNLVYAFEPRQGVSHACNCAIEHSKGELLVIVDDDELIDSRLAEVYLGFFDAHPECSAAGGVVLPLYGVELPGWFSPWIDELISGEFHLGDKVRPMPAGRYPRGGNFAMRRTMVERYGMFNTELGRKGGSILGGEEKDLLLRLRDGGEKIYYLPQAIIHHVIPDYKVTDDYFERLTAMIGRSERLRTRSISKGAYAGRLATEAVKWGGAAVLAAWHTLTGHPARGRYLLKMRLNITKGLLGGKKEA